MSNPPRKLLDVVRETIRLKHYSPRTEEAYVQWIKRFVRFHNKRHPREMGATEIEAFLTYLAVGQHVAASTQNQALCALLFLYREVLRQDLGDIQAIRAKRTQRLPTVLTRQKERPQRCPAGPSDPDDHAGQRSGSPAWRRDADPLRDQNRF